MVKDKNKRDINNTKTLSVSFLFEKNIQYFQFSGIKDCYVYYIEAPCTHYRCTVPKSTMLSNIAELVIKASRHA